MRRSSRAAFAVSWVVFAVTVVLAWRKALAVPDGRRDVTGLTVATVCGAPGLVLLMIWLQEYERPLPNHAWASQPDSRTPTDGEGSEQPGAILDADDGD